VAEAGDFLPQSAVLIISLASAVTFWHFQWKRHFCFMDKQLHWRAFMSAYDLKQIVRMWEREKLTSEQAIGQILLQTQILSERIGVLEQYVSEMKGRGFDKKLESSRK
jgi:hypothetical protein